MSHVAKVDIVVTDLDCLAKACEDCGLVLNRGQISFRWYGRWMNDYSKDDAAYKSGIKPEDYGKCIHAISVPGNPSAYEVGVVKNPNGDGFLLIWDFYAGGHGLQAHLGGPKDCYKVMDAYSKHAVLKQAEMQGFMCQEEVDEDGGITLTMYDYS